MNCLSSTFFFTHVVMSFPYELFDQSSGGVLDNIIPVARGLCFFSSTHLLAHRGHNENKVFYQNGRDS